MWERRGVQKSPLFRGGFWGGCEGWESPNMVTLKQQKKELFISNFASGECSHVWNSNINFFYIRQIFLLVSYFFSAIALHTVCDHHHYTTINPFLKAPSLPFHQLANPIMSTLPLAFLLFTHNSESERDRCYHRGKKVYLYARFCLSMQCGGELSTGKLLLLWAKPGVADFLLESRAKQQSALLSYCFWETNWGRIR